MSILQTFALNSWQNTLDNTVQIAAIAALEQGKVLFMPQLPFELTVAETALLNPQWVTKNSKNISYHLVTQELRGAQANDSQIAQLQTMLKRFALAAQSLVQSLFPTYITHLQIARTSLRPVEIAGRANPSYRKDDTRLHVDAFPSNPNQGRRILRVFTNVNPHQQARVWRLGEPFEEVAKQFLPQIKPSIPGSAFLLENFKITKSRRTAYDHYMLQIHDRMKACQQYQATVKFEEIHFPAGSTWIVQTDEVSHAALAGQHILEQTFYLPVKAMTNPELSPLRILERLLQKSLD